LRAMRRNKRCCSAAPRMPRAPRSKPSRRRRSGLQPRAIACSTHSTISFCDASQPLSPPRRRSSDFARRPEERRSLSAVAASGRATLAPRESAGFRAGPGGRGSRGSYMNSPGAFQTRRAARMDARRFRTEPWRASTKIPKVHPVAGLFCRGGPFFLVTSFFGPAKKKSLGRGSGRKPWLYRKNESNVHGLLASLVPAGSSCGRPARFALVPPSRG
jgi:hypothetical protein